jgi:PIN domain nuclease of toxin-antitoxin system
MLLLDSHVLLWVLTGRRPLGRDATAKVDEAPAVFVSAATVLELTIKAMLGKVSIPQGLVARLTDAGFDHLDVTADHAEALSAYPELARHDPFDRLLVAQAATESLELMTADRVLLAMGLPFVVDAVA